MAFEDSKAFLQSNSLIAKVAFLLLVVMVFAIVLCMLFMHFYTGIRGRAATRFVLLAYLFLTLAYPGVKFVRDVLLSS